MNIGSATNLTSTNSPSHFSSEELKAAPTTATVAQSILANNSTATHQVAPIAKKKKKKKKPPHPPIYPFASFSQETQKFISDLFTQLRPGGPSNVIDLFLCYGATLCQQIDENLSLLSPTLTEEFSAFLFYIQTWGFHFWHEKGKSTKKEGSSLSFEEFEKEGALWFVDLTSQKKNFNKIIPSPYCLANIFSFNFLSENPKEIFDHYVHDKIRAANKEKLLSLRKKRPEYWETRKNFCSLLKAIRELVYNPRFYVFFELPCFYLYQKSDSNPNSDVGFCRILSLILKGNRLLTKQRRTPVEIVDLDFETTLDQEREIRDPAKVQSLYSRLIEQTVAATFFLEKHRFYFEKAKNNQITKQEFEKSEIPLHHITDEEFTSYLEGTLTYSRTLHAFLLMATKEYMVKCRIMYPTEIPLNIQSQTAFLPVGFQILQDPLEDLIEWKREKLPPPIQSLFDNILRACRKFDAALLPHLDYVFTTNLKALLSILQSTATLSDDSIAFGIVIAKILTGLKSPFETLQNDLQNTKKAFEALLRSEAISHSREQDDLFRPYGARFYEVITPTLLIYGQMIYLSECLLRSHFASDWDEETYEEYYCQLVDTLYIDWDDFDEANSAISMDPEVSLTPKIAVKEESPQAAFHPIVSPITTTKEPSKTGQKPKNSLLPSKKSENRRLNFDRGIKARKLMRELERFGFILDRIQGSHRIYKLFGQQLVVPVSGKVSTLPRGTLKSIEDVGNQILSIQKDS